MNFQAKNKFSDNDIQVEITPLIDIVFLLLIFFMVSTTFKAESKLSVELPQSSSQQERSVEQLIVLSLDASGVIEFKGNIITPEELVEVLGTLTDGDKERPVLVRADKDVTHGLVISVIDRIKRAGFRSISVGTKVR